MFKRFSNFNRGMTYVELIVVLTIMGILSATVIFNGRDFNKKIQIRNLADEIALKIVEAQKSALAGKIPINQPDGLIWTPAYGVYFNGAQNDLFVSFNDFDNNKHCDIGCENNGGGEYIEAFFTNINSDGIISELKMSENTVSNLSFVFTRPNSNAVIYSTDNPSADASYGSIKIESSSDSTIFNFIKVYSSGRIEIE